MDFLDLKVQEIRARLAELRPLVEEYRRLEQVMKVLDSPAPKPPGKPGRPKKGATT